MITDCKNVRLNDISGLAGFWKRRYELNRTVSVPAVYRRFKESGRMDSLLYNHERTGLPLEPPYDSDVAKWIEAVAYLIEWGNPCVEEQRVIDEIAESMRVHQHPSGYINGYFQQLKPDEIYKHRLEHELYTIGHLIEAAIAYDRATGKHTMLNVMCRCADGIYTDFAVEKTAAFVTCGHEEIELALLQLGEYTHNDKYTELAVHFLGERGKHREEYYDWVNEKYDQSNATVYDLAEAEGHAVRAMYLYIAMAEEAALKNDEKLMASCERLFDDIYYRKLYVTGGIGSARIGESFTSAYDLPNLSAYSESCAAIGLLLFCRAMQNRHFDSRYADTAERVMYNTLLSSASLSGKAFFYENPLEICLREIDKETSIAKKNRTVLPPVQRKELFECSCCPPNINRTVARIADFALSQDKSGFIVQQYMSLTAKTDMGILRLQTDYPRSGHVKIIGSQCAGGLLRLRKPAWCGKYVLRIDGKETKAEEKNGYLIVPVKSDFVAELELDMTPRFYEANPNVQYDSGRVCLMRGPVVYCLESVDNGENLHALRVDPFAPVSERYEDEYGVCVCECNGYRSEEFASLYRPLEAKERETILRFIPYFAFANRGESDMAVWIRR